MSKEGIPALLVGTGTGMSQAESYPVIQVIGCIVGVIGLIIGAIRIKVALMQAGETKRANDLNQLKWEHEIKNESTNSKEASEESYDGKETYQEA